MNDDLKELVCIILICLIAVSSVVVPLWIIDIKSCHAYAASKKADHSEYTWFTCYITKDNITYTKDEYTQSEVGYLIK